MHGQEGGQVERLLVDMEHVRAQPRDQPLERRVVVDVVPAVKADRQHL
jgi:hypothetical protein